MGDHVHEPLKSVTVMLEEDQVEVLNELAGEYSQKLGQEWDLDAVVRLAVGDFLSRLGRIS